MHEVLVIEGREPPKGLGKIFAKHKEIKTHAASDGAAALELLGDEEANVDVILADIELPDGVSCLELVLKARSLAPDARLILLKPDDFVHVTDELGVTRFARRDQPVKKLEERVLELISDEADSGATLANMELLDLVQLAHVSHTSAILHVRQRKSKGLIGFMDGEVLHAKYGDQVGEEALHRLLAFSQGDIFLQAGGEFEEITVERGWDALANGLAAAVLERRAELAEEDAALSLDEVITESDVSELLGVVSDSLDGEGGELQSPLDLTNGEPLFSAADLMEIGDLSSAESGDQDINEIAVEETVSLEEGLAMISGPDMVPSGTGLPLEAVLSPPEEPSPFEIRPHFAGEMSETGKRLHELLVQFCEEIPEFIATDLVHRDDGMSVGGMTAVEDYDSAVASAFYSDVLNTCHRAVFGFGLDEGPEELLVTTNVAYLLIRSIEHTPYMHLTLMHRTGNLGIARVVLRRYAPLFADLLPVQ